MLDWLQQELDPVAFSLPIFGGLEIYWYGILIAVGIGLGSWWAAREIEKRGESSDHLYNGLLLVVVAGYLFARLGYVFLDILGGATYESFLDVINLRLGGANIMFGFVGAALVGIWYARRQRLNMWHYADVAGPTILLAQAIGRWGNFINQELYGQPTELPWGILIEAPHRIAPYNDLALYPLDTRFHPTFLYESLALFIGFVLLSFLNRRYRDSWRPGTLFGLFLIWWGGNRAWIEFFRPDQLKLGESLISYSMLIAVGILIAGVMVLLYRYDKLPQSEKARRRQLRKGRVRKPKRRRVQDVNGD